MDFIKKNWLKLCVGIFALAGFIFTLLKLIAVSGDSMEFKMYLPTIGLMLAFAGIIAYVIFAMLGKDKTGAYVLSATSVVALIFMIGWAKYDAVGMAPAIQAIEGMGQGANIDDMIGALLGTLGAMSYTLILNVIVFGVGPLLFALCKLGVFKDGKTVTAMLAVIGLVLTTLLVFASTNTQGSIKEYTRANVGTLLIYIGMALVFAGILAYTILPNYNMEKIAKCIFAGMAVVAFILILVGIIMGVPAMDLYRNAGMDAIVDINLYTKLTTLVVFGIAPITYACKKLFCKKVEQVA